MLIIIVYTIIRGRPKRRSPSIGVHIITIQVLEVLFEFLDHLSLDLYLCQNFLHGDGLLVSVIGFNCLLKATTLPGIMLLTLSAELLLPFRRVTFTFPVGPLLIPATLLTFAGCGLKHFLQLELLSIGPVDGLIVSETSDEIRLIHVQVICIVTCFNMLTISFGKAVIDDFTDLVIR